MTALMAALLLSAAIGTTSARNLSVSNRNIRVTWSRLEFEGPVNVRCRVTLEGSFHTATISKVTGTLIGTVTRADVDTNNCTNARARAEGLPWHITYEGFSGTLPRIEELFFILRNLLLKLERLIGASTECRYGTATDNLTARGIISGSEPTNLQPVAGRNTVNLLERWSETLLVRCPASASLFTAATDGIITLLGTTTRIRVTLI